MRLSVQRVGGCSDEHLRGTLRREPQLPRVLRGRLHLLGRLLLLGGGRTSGRRDFKLSCIIGHLLQPDVLYQTVLILLKESCPRFVFSFRINAMIIRPVLLDHS